MEEREATYWEHLEELLLRLRRVAVLFVLATAVLPWIPLSLSPYKPLAAELPGYVISQLVPERIVFLGNVYEIKLVQTSPFAGLRILFNSALVIGLLATSPYLAYQLYEFLKPGLYPHEERVLRYGGLIAVALFLVGASIAFFVVIPVTFKLVFITSSLVVGEGRLVAYADVGQVFNTAIILVVVMGLLFEAPLIVYTLVYLGALNPKYFRGDGARYLLLLIAVLAAIVSPDPSGLGMIMITIPYFLMIIAAARLGERRARRRSPSST